MTWEWHPIPHVGSGESFGFGLLILNALLYAVALLIVLGVAAAVMQVLAAFVEGYRRGRNNDRSAPPPQ